MTKAKKKPAARPRAPRARRPRPLDCEAVRGALALIADHGRNNTARLVEHLQAGYGLKLTFSTGTHRAAMLGVTGTATHGDLGALEAWGRAARRALLRARTL